MSFAQHIGIDQAIGPDEDARLTERERFDSLRQKVLRPLMENAVDSAATVFGLTPKEKQVLGLLLDGLSSKEVAVISHNTEKTVKSHAYSIFKKVGVSGRAELFATMIGRR